MKNIKFKKIDINVKNLDLYLFNLKQINKIKMFELNNCLSTYIIKNSYKYKSKLKFKEYLFSHYIRRYLLSIKCTCSPEKLKFKFCNGKPYLLLYKKIFFNITHSDKYLIIAIYNKDIGIDIQKIIFNNNNIKIAKRFFLKYEYLQLKNITNISHQQHLFYWFWVYKEATIKLYAEHLISGLYKYSFFKKNLYKVQPKKNRNIKYYQINIRNKYFVCVATLN